MLGLIFVVGGGLAIIFRSQLDAANMRHTPRWLKPPDGGGVYGPDQRESRVKRQTIGMSVLALLGVALIVVGLLHP